MIDPFADTKRQESHSNQKGGNELPRNGRDGNQAASYRQNAPPMVELRFVVVHRHQQLTNFAAASPPLSS
jgi:hypothetical protein